MLPSRGRDQALITGQMRRRRPDLRRGTRSAVAATHAASIAGVHRFRPTPRADLNSRLNRMDWASVESSRNRTPLWTRV
jgi:hypothetical protein